MHWSEKLNKQFHGDAEVIITSWLSGRATQSFPSMADNNGPFLHATPNTREKRCLFPNICIHIVKGKTKWFYKDYA